MRMKGGLFAKRTPTFSSRAFFAFAGALACRGCRLSRDRPEDVGLGAIVGDGARQGGQLNQVAAIVNNRFQVLFELVLGRDHEHAVNHVVAERRRHLAKDQLQRIAQRNAGSSQADFGRDIDVCVVESLLIDENRDLVPSRNKVERVFE